MELKEPEVAFEETPPEIVETPREIEIPEEIVVERPQIDPVGFVGEAYERIIERPITTTLERRVEDPGVIEHIVRTRTTVVVEGTLMDERRQRKEANFQYLLKLRKEAKKKSLVGKEENLEKDDQADLEKFNHLSSKSFQKQIIGGYLSTIWSNDYRVKNNHLSFGD